MASCPEDSRSIRALEAENARLISLLESHGIPWRQPVPAAAPTAAPQEPSRYSTSEKLAIFAGLFRGRPDVFAVRWEGKSSGKSGYAPACANEWRAGVCEKPRIKCSDCSRRVLIPVSDAVIFKHLAGDHVVGTYPLLGDDSCHFLAVDFDEADWRDDVRAFAQSCLEMAVPVAVEISRSGNGAHAWVFFDTSARPQRSPLRSHPPEGRHRSAGLEPNRDPRTGACQRPIAIEPRVGTMRRQALQRS